MDGAVAYTILYGLAREGGVQHTAVLDEADHRRPHCIAQVRLAEFPSVEVRVQSVAWFDLSAEGQDA